MEKVIYALWRQKSLSQEELNRRLLEEVAPKVAALDNVRGLRLNLQDADVARAAPLRQAIATPQMDATAQVWVDICHDAFRQPIDALFLEVAEKIGAWLVTESAPIPNTRHPAQEGKRTAGWSQFCYLAKPERFSYDEWRHNWQELHTRVGIDTQSNFEYRQHLVQRTLVAGPIAYVAMVEECFPTDAMDNPEVFYDAAHNPEKYKKNLDIMLKSCARFIDMGKEQTIDVLPNSQYEVKTPRWR